MTHHRLAIDPPRDDHALDDLTEYQHEQALRYDDEIGCSFPECDCAPSVTTEICSALCLNWRLS